MWSMSTPFTQCKHCGIPALRCEIPVFPQQCLRCMGCAHDSRGSSRMSYLVMARNKKGTTKSSGKTIRGKRGDIFAVLKLQKDQRFIVFYE